ncbi:uncharacterized protein CYBJADRAFT_166788 [Cyberlindnera jadinii NRRL Y-1542]|uniref:Uncharacterized protein n=1 Tax=Cyberlindnera jadinii (strain ATCC 18201 / CBS 1600 / BCRC 20928 / JCM 3617 / NBRC 0987 / NRRL Y-1542) TaxID=983966 RepID=A0A1E4S686_CYBJN|nr:hypothetical protein CYBJADRAFT_166788 [Cyberlindnera jadinii NRRL Y-1542]ODV75025.1 hypothetical protein CYBJADRAFT_166788 [Cyberlindnera jadinii NRRL Y-1542]
MADRIRDRQRNAAQVAERALEEIRYDGTFDHDPNSENIIEDEHQRPQRPRSSVYNPGLEKCWDYCHALLIDAELRSFCCDRGKVSPGEIFKEPPQYMKDILLDPITTVLSLSSLDSKSTDDSRGGTSSMTINGRLFHIFDEIYTLDPGLATNRHLELLRGVLQKDEEYNTLEDYISKIEIVQQEITEMGSTREETIVQFTNIEPTAPTNSEHHTSLLLEV